MVVAELRRVARQLAEAADLVGAGQLSERKQREREFHNDAKDTVERESELPADVYATLHGNQKFYSVVRSSHEYLQRWLARYVPGRVFLDYACGTGGQSAEAARLGSALSLGIDISDGSIAKAREHAAARGVGDRCIFIHGDCERTGLPDESVDIVLCSGMLHHVDLSYAFPELRRILKPGGRILGFEALAYNPLIRLYRRLTPAMRTAWEKEHILSMRDVRFAAHFFDVGEVRFWHLLALGATVFRPYPRVFEAVLSVLDRLDAVVLRVPGIRLMAWQFTFELVKRTDS